MYALHTTEQMHEENDAMKIRIVSDKSFIRQGQPSLNECLEAALYLPPKTFDVICVFLVISMQLQATRNQHSRIFESLRSIQTT